MSLSSQNSSQMDQSDRVGNGSEDRNQHKVERHRTVADLGRALTKDMDQKRIKFTSILCVALLHIAKPLSEKFDRDIFVVHQ